jgi:hypothetical protein
MNSTNTLTRLHDAWSAMRRLLSDAITEVEMLRLLVDLRKGGGDRDGTSRS